MARRAYPTDLTDAQWAILEPLIPSPKPGGRPAAHPRRELVNAMLYVLRGGIAWRQLPAELPPATTVWRSSPAGCGQERGSSSTTPFATAPACGTDALRCRPR